MSKAIKWTLVCGTAFIILAGLLQTASLAVFMVNIKSGVWPVLNGLVWLALLGALISYAVGMLFVLLEN